MMRDIATNYGYALLPQEALDYLSTGPMCITDLYDIVFRADYPRVPGVGETPVDPLPGAFQWMSHVAWHLTGGDRDITVGDYPGDPAEIAYTRELPDQSRGLPLISRGEILYTTGMEVSEMELRLICGTSAMLPDLLPGVAGTPIKYSVQQGARLGVFTGARIRVRRLVSNQWFSVMPVYPAIVAGQAGDMSGIDTAYEVPTWLRFVMFEGIVSKVTVTAFGVVLTVTAETEKFNLPFPRYTVTAKCQNAVYDQMCQVVPSLHPLVTGSEPSIASDAYGTLISAAHTSTQPAGQVHDFTNGTLHFNRRMEAVPTIRTIIDDGPAWGPAYTGYVRISPASPIAPVPDGWTVYACKGCTKTLYACEHLHNNVVNYNGFPYVPQPEMSR